MHAGLSMRSEELDDRGGKFGCREHARMVARNADEPGILQESRQLLRVGAFVPVADRDEGRDRDLSQKHLGTWERAIRGHVKVCGGSRCGNPVGSSGLALSP